MGLSHQIDVLKRSGIRPQFMNADRLVWVFLSTVWPRWPEAMEIVNVDIVKCWHGRGFRHYLLGKSRRRRPGRPAIELEIRSLIQRMSRQNMLWGTPRIHGELLKLIVGIDSDAYQSFADEKKIEDTKQEIMAIMDQISNTLAKS